MFTIQSFEKIYRHFSLLPQVELLTADPFGGFDDIAVFENIPIHIEVYFDTIEISCNITVVQNFAPNSLNLGLFDKKVYSATLNAKLGIIIEK